MNKKYCLFVHLYRYTWYYNIIMCIHTPPKPLLLLFLSSSECHAHIIHTYLRPSRLNDDGTCGRKSNDIIRIISNKVIKPPERGTLYQMPGSAEKADSRTCGVGTKVNMCMLYTCTIYIYYYTRCCYY